MLYSQKKARNGKESQTKAESLDSSKPPLSSPPSSPTPPTNVYHANWLDATNMITSITAIFNVEIIVKHGKNNCKGKRPGWQFYPS